MQGFNKRVTEFNGLLEGVVPLATDSSTERMRKAIKSLTIAHKFQTVESSLNTYKSTLTLYFSTRILCLQSRRQMEDMNDTASIVENIVCPEASDTESVAESIAESVFSMSLEATSSVEGGIRRKHVNMQDVFETVIENTSASESGYESTDEDWLARQGPRAVGTRSRNQSSECQSILYLWIRKAPTRLKILASTNPPNYYPDRRV